MKIRLATPEDAESVAAIYAPIVLETTISFEWDAPSAEDFRTRIAKTLAKYPWLVAVDGSDEVAGFVYASSHRDPPSYQWSVKEDARGRGVGTALYTELFRQLVSLGYSVGFKPLGVYENVGFKFGAWRDVGWWQRELQPPVPHPESPKRELAVSAAGVT